MMEGLRKEFHEVDKRSDLGVSPQLKSLLVYLLAVSKLLNFPSFPFYVIEYGYSYYLSIDLSIHLSIYLSSIYLSG